MSDGQRDEVTGGSRIAAARGRAASAKRAIGAGAALAFAALLAVVASSEKATASRGTTDVPAATAPASSQQQAFDFGSGNVEPALGAAQANSHAS